MTTKEKIRLLKILKIIVLIFYVPMLLFYLGIVLPEYLACVDCNEEGAMGRDIWGSEVQCFGESKDVSESFFQFSILVISALSILLMLVYYFIYRLKKFVK